MQKRIECRRPQFKEKKRVECVKNRRLKGMAEIWAYALQDKQKKKILERNKEEHKILHNIM